MLRPNCVVVVLLCFSSVVCADEEPPTFAKLTLKMHAALKAEATTRNSREHSDSVIDLCDFYAELRMDARYTGSDTLQGLAARVRRRLIDVRDKIRLRLKREQIAKPANFDAKMKAIDQWSSGSAADGGRNVSRSYSDETLEKLSGGFAPGGVQDQGWMLVELITRTISPSFWTTQGGPGVAVYYPLQRALVVRATTRVHEDVQALLRALGGLPQ